MKSNTVAAGLRGVASPKGALKADRIVTGLIVAAGLRASELYLPEGKRIYEDYFGRRLMPPAWRVFLLPGVRHALAALLERRLPGGMGMLLCRTRYTDDALTKALKEGCEQVVNLGAGLDTRAFRIPGIEQARVFEVDQPGSMAWKQARITQLFGSVPPHVRFIPIDFDRQELGQELERAGYRPGARAFFIWEGVTQYITAEAVDGTLRYAASSAAPGSEIAFTYILREIVDGTTRSAVYRKAVELVAQGGSPWVFGLDPAELEAYLAERGLTLVEDIGAANYRARYLEPIGRKMDIFAGERIALARVGGQPNGLVSS